MRTLIGVVGSSNASEAVLNAAYQVGKAVMNTGYSLVCGGLGGVMEAACRGAFDEAGPHTGRIIGILPGSQKTDANPYVDIVIPTGFGYARNFIIACCADAIVAVSGASGTLSEIAMAWQFKKPIVALENLPGISAQFIKKSLDADRPGTGERRILGASDAREALAIIKNVLG
jgi:uncharacterized protein (TIGR00725 family)